MDSTLRTDIEKLTALVSRMREREAHIQAECSKLGGDIDNLYSCIESLKRTGEYLTRYTYAVYMPEDVVDTLFSLVKRQENKE